MVINSKKFIKLQKKLEKNIIGKNGSSKGLGQDITIQSWIFTLNSYGDETLVSLDNEQKIKGVVVDAIDEEIGHIDKIKIADGMVTMYIPSSAEVKDTQDLKRLFITSNGTFVLERETGIGQVCNITAVIREVVLRPIRK